MKAPLLPPGDVDQVENPAFCFISVPTFSIKEQFPIPLGHTGTVLTMSDVLLPHSHLHPHSPQAGSSRFWELSVLQRAPFDPLQNFQALNLEEADSDPINE